ncbi:ribosome rescue protein RqcH [Haladaptatus sp. F3-133]|uniref:Ribosome rescue protein RqcH n=1 Tax=Halorutilus salinus TaxID=2487751 RepID=A0A9Q4C5A1_9EURY|nr:ribosome rescue protein RqcH [Halorutilus salinus]MCX2819317.1 ribosome rescue protein RqcH [Halorutilus salinus]
MTSPKRELTSVDIAAVVGELQTYVGAKFDKFYQYGDDTVRMKIRDYDAGRADLFAEVGETKRLHFVDEPPDAPQRPPNLPMLMRKRLSGGDLVAVEQHGFDRVVRLVGERGDETYTIIVELFGDGNFVFTDSDGVVLRSLRTVRLKTRTVAGGEPYEYPPERTDPSELSYDGFVDEMEDSGSDLVRTLASVLGFGGTYAEELCVRAGVEKELGIEDAGTEEYEAVYAEVTDLFDSLQNGDLEPRVVYDDGAPVDATPLPLVRYEENETEAYETFNEALDAYFEALEDHDEDEEGGDEAVDRQRRIVEQQERAIEEREEEEERLREKAEALYESYGVVDELLGAVGDARGDGASWDEVSDTLGEAREEGVGSAEIVERIDQNNDTVYVELDGYEIPLSPRDGVESNASALYEEAKEVAEKREATYEALEDAREELERMKREREEDGGGEEETTTLSERGENWYDRFRWFRTSDGFLVIGGRDADQNDEIYKKYTDPDDVFFHTQAPGGPVTVLKRTEPDEPKGDIEVPDRSREEAARFAGIYSSVWDTGQGAAEVYSVPASNISKTPESGEYIEKGSVVVRGERTYYTVEMEASVGMRLDDEAGVIGGPPSAVEPRCGFSVRLEPGRYSRNDTAKRVYRRFREELDENVVRRITTVDEVRRFLPSGGSRMID